MKTLCIFVVHVRVVYAGNMYPPFSICYRIAYTDKGREKQRLIRLEKDRAAAAEKKAAQEKDKKHGVEKVS